MKGRRVEGEKLRRLKASIPGFHTIFHQLNDILHFAAFAAVPILLKKPSGGPKGLIGPPCNVAPGRWRQKKLIFDKAVYFFYYSTTRS
jgi:hypothetical protein